MSLVRGLSDDRNRALFSNGTEFDLWQFKWCLRCVYQHPEFGGPCSDFDVAFTEERVPDILVADELSWTCLKFERMT